MPLTVEQLVRRLVDAELLLRDELDEFVAGLSPRPADGEQLANALVRQRKLTKYQAQVAYAGKGPPLVLDNYVILDRIGAGGMGEVFLARHRRMGRMAALKILPAKVTDNPDAVRRFHREVQAIAKLSHPNIVAAFDAGESNGTHYCVMEYVDGRDLASIVKSDGPLPVDQAVDAIVQAATGMEYAHQRKVIHRDIKPANLLRDEKGTVKVLDLGLARFEHDDRESVHTELTNTGTVMGTVDYMAPEQALNTKHADARSDVYSLGCTLFTLLTGRRVFDGESLIEKVLAHRDQPIPSLRQFRADVPPGIDAVFQKMVAKKPAERFQTMGEVVATLLPIHASTRAASAVPADSAPETEPELHRFLAGMERTIELKDPEATATLAHAPQVQPAVAVAHAAPQASPVLAQEETVPSALFGETFSSLGLTKRPRKTWRDYLHDRNVQVFGGGALVCVLLLIVAAVWFGGRSPRAQDDTPPIAAPARRAVDSEENPTVDLLALIDPDKHAIAGSWKRDGAALISPGGHSRIRLPYRLPKEYTLEIEAEPLDAKHDTLSVIVPIAGRPTVIGLDAFGGTASGLHLLDGRAGDQNATTYRKRIFQQRMPVTVYFHIGPNFIRVKDAYRTIIDWKGKASRLSNDPLWRVPDGETLFLGSFTPFRITDIKLKPLSGRGSVWSWEAVQKKWLAEEERIRTQRAKDAEEPFKQLEAKFTAKGVTFASFAKDVAAFKAKHGGTPAAIKAAEMLMRLPSPLDKLDRKILPADCLAYWKVIGKEPPQELVGVLGEHARRQWGAGMRLAVSRNGKVIASVGQDNVISLWDSASLSLLRQIRPDPSRRVRCLALSPDGSKLVEDSEMSGGAPQIWDTATGKLTARLESTLKQAVLCAAFSPNGRQVVTGRNMSNDGTLQLWDVATGAEVARFEDPAQDNLDLVFAPSGAWIASANRDAKIRIWDVASKKLVRRLEGHTTAVTSITVSPDGIRLASTAAFDRSSQIRIWELTSGKLLKSFDSFAYLLRFTPDGRQLVAGGTGDARLYWFAVDSGAGAERTAEGMQHNPIGLDFAAGGKHIVVGADNGTVRLWDVKTRKEVRPLIGPVGAAWTAAFSPDLSELLTTHADTRAYAWVWNQRAPRLAIAMTHPARQASWLPAGDRLITWESRAKLRDAKSGKAVAIFGGPEFTPSFAAVSPDGRAAAIPTDTIGRVMIYDLTTKPPSVRHEFTAHKNNFGSAAFSPDSRLLITGGNDHAARVWDLSGKAPTELMQLGGSVDTGWPNVYKVAWASPTTAVVARGAEVQLWSVLRKDVKPQRSLGQPDSVRLTELAVDPIGHTIATVDVRGQVRLWNVTDGKLLREWQLPGPVHAVAFANDGRHIATANGNGTVYILRLPMQRKEFALSFDGKDDYVEIPTLQFTTAAPMTLELIVSGHQSTPHEQSLAQVSGAGGEMRLKYLTGRKSWDARIVAANWDSGNRAIQSHDFSEKPMHLSAVWDGTRIRLFVDGKQSQTTREAAKKPDIAALFRGTRLGSLGEKQHFKGRMHAVRISKVARYTKDFTPAKRFTPDKDTLALYHFDEGQGDKLIDSSGNGHHGKIHGATWVNADGTNIDFDRQAANAAFRTASQGKATLTVRVGERESTIRRVDDLPAEPFQLIGIQLETRGPLEELIAAVSRLKSLTSFRCYPANVQEPRISDRHVTLLGEVGTLTVLSLAVSEITDASVPSLMRLPNLDWLSLAGSKLTEKGFAGLLGLRKLKRLDLRDTQLGDAELQKLAALPVLTYIRVSKTRVTAAGAALFRNARPKCHFVWEPAGNTALSFDGKDDYVEIPTLQFDAAKPFTVEGWLSPKSAVGKHATFYSIGPRGGAYLINHPYANDDVWFYGAINAERSGGLGGGVPRGLIHVALVSSSTGMSLFANGRKFDARAELIPKQIRGKRRTVIGASQRSPFDASLHRWFYGTIDELRVSSTARYTKDFTPTKRFTPDKDTLALYHFDKGQGDKLIDSSGNGHHGKIHGATWVNADGTPLAPAAK